MKINNRKEKNHGMNWIRPEKRLAIYLRDGLACAYCGEGIEEDAKLTLDHLDPYTNGGNNEAKNLITACHRCNSSRGKRPWKEFAKAVAEYKGTNSSIIIKHIGRATKRNLPMEEAKTLIARRNGLQNVLVNFRNGKE